MKKILPLLAMIITVSCLSAPTPATTESPTLISNSIETSMPVPTNTVTLTASIPLLTSTATPLQQTSSIVQLMYPNHENCIIKVDAQKWEITDEGEKSIGSASRIILISHKQGMGAVLFVRHKNHAGCELSWMPHGYRAEEKQRPLETINGTTWEIRIIEMIMSKVYIWPQSRDIQFVQRWPLDIPQKESCQTDIYEILSSLECK